MIGIKKISLIFFILFCIVSQSKGQFKVQYWDTSRGLSNNWISDIVQDEQGYIWIATQYGLNRFDGYDFEFYQYEPNNIHSLSSNWVRKVEQDSLGQFWLNAYLGGLNTFVPETGIVDRDWYYEEDSTRIKVVRSLHCDSEGTVWLGNSKGFYAKQTDAHYFQKLWSTSVYDIVESKGQYLFLLTKEGIYVFNKKTEAAQKIDDWAYPEIQSLFVDTSGDLLLFLKNQLQLVSEHNGNWTKAFIPIDNTALSNLFTQSPVFEDHQNRLWFGGEKGITILEANRKDFKTFSYASIFPKGTLAGKALCFFEDEHLNFWIGTTKGLLMQSPYTMRFAKSEKWPELDTFHLVRSVIEVNQSLWIASENGLFKVDIDNKQPPQKILDERILALIESKDGYLYAGGRQLYKIDPELLTTQVIPKGEQSLQGGQVWALEEGLNGEIWIGSLGMLQSYDPIKKECKYFSNTQMPALWDAPSQALLLDTKGRLWAGSLYSGLYLFENLASGKIAIRHFYCDEKNPEGLSNNLVVALAEGKDGSIWVATDGGLNRIDSTHFQIKRYLKEDGLVDEKIMGVLVDEKGMVWGSTIGNGIFRLDPQTEVFTFYNQKDGLLSNNFLLNAYYKNQDGLLFFGSDNGVQIIAPEAIDDIDKSEILFHFTSLIFADSTQQGKEIDLTDRAEISFPYSYRPFTIHYSTLNFFQAEKTAYEYQLEEIHSNWLPNGEKREILFTDLSPGTYTLRVRAINPDVVFKQAEQQLRIKITPPWWKTKSAFIIYVIAFVGVMWLGYRIQLKQHSERTEAKESEELSLHENDTDHNIEDAFVLKVRSIVEQHLEDSNFSIAFLCQELGISRVHLHRKLKGLTNQSSSHFIRHIRLQKARILLQNTDLNVSEVAYKVGFTDPAYFSRLYSEAYGESPSASRNREK